MNGVVGRTFSCLARLLRLRYRYTTGFAVVALVSGNAIAQTGQDLQAAVGASVAVTTYHNNTLRTGWNAQETRLTPATVASSAFHLLRTVTLDDQVDAQPLIVPGQAIVSQGTHNVAYVVTENDTVYAIDTDTGAVLLRTSLGTPVPLTMLPGQCDKNTNHVGINSTPVIDLTTQTLYVIAFTLEGTSLVYRIHALDLSTLQDKVPAPVITAKQKLTDGSTLAFLPGGDRQRVALLLSKGAIYAAFASFCDIRSDLGRGWVLRWHTDTLVPLKPAELLDRLATAPDNVFLSTVWMSGYGIAANPVGDLFFVTGNSDPSGTTYNAVTNLAESVVKLPPNMSSVLDFFTPSGATFGVAALDKVDNDFGSGGLLLLPPQPGAVPNIAVAAGKVGQLYVLNADNLGGHAVTGPDKVLGVVPIGPCWCGQSYFTASDGVGRVVSSGGSSVTVWRVQTTPTVALKSESVSAPVAARRNQGFFTSISSNGTKPGTAIIWAAAGPVNKQATDIVLYAFNAKNGATLMTATAGNWPNTLPAANTVPVVANGQVYVASFRQLAIFGLGAAAPGATVERFAAPPRPTLAVDEHEFFGIVRSASPDRIELVTRTGAVVMIDPTPALQTKLSVVPVPQRGRAPRGRILASGVLEATAILRVPDVSDLWPDDR